MTDAAPKNDKLSVPEGDEEDDMTSIVSSDQRKLLQQATKEKEAATLERDTAKPPPGDGAVVDIPKAGGVPKIESEKPPAKVSEKPPPARSEKPPAEVAAPPVERERLATQADTPAAKAASTAPRARQLAQRTLPLWVIFAFFLLAVTIAYVLRPGG